MLTLLSMLALTANAAPADTSVRATLDDGQVLLGGRERPGYTPIWRDDW